MKNWHIFGLSIIRFINHEGPPVVKLPIFFGQQTFLIRGGLVILGLHYTYTYVYIYIYIYMHMLYTYICVLQLGEQLVRAPLLFQIQYTPQATCPRWFYVPWPQWTPQSLFGRLLICLDLKWSGSFWKTAIDGRPRPSRVDPATHSKHCALAMAARRFTHPPDLQCSLSLCLRNKACCWGVHLWTAGIPSGEHARIIIGNHSVHIYIYTNYIYIYIHI